MLSWLLAASLALAPQASAASLSPAPPQSAAANLPPASPQAAVASLPPATLPTPEQVFAVPADLRARLAAALPLDNASARERLDRLVAFMTDEAGMGLQYEADATLTVEQAWSSRQANCLTWTLVFLALAPQAGLEAHAQEISQSLNWYQLEHTVYLNSHVNAAVKVSHNTLVVDVSGEDLIARDPPFPISNQRLLSHYYNNRAVGLMATGDTAAAALYSAKAIELAPGHADHWSNVGVLRVRTGDLEGGVAAYARALELDPRNASALFNAVILARRVGDTANETRLRARLARVQRHDPFHQFLRGLELEHQGALLQAISHYRTATRLRPGEHRFHAALARACLAAGEQRCATSALHRARAASRGETRAGYQAQLEALRASRAGRGAIRQGGFPR